MGWPLDWLGLIDIMGMTRDKVVDGQGISAGMLCIIYTIMS